MNFVPNYLAGYVDTSLNHQFSIEFINSINPPLSLEEAFVKAMEGGFGNKGISQKMAAAPYLKILRAQVQKLQETENVCLSEILLISQSRPLEELLDVRSIKDRLPGIKDSEIPKLLLGQVNEVIKKFIVTFIKQESLQSDYLAHKFLIALSNLLINFQFTEQMTKLMGPLNEDGFTDAVSNCLYSYEYFKKNENGLKKDKAKINSQIDRLHALLHLSFEHGDDELFLEALVEVFTLQYGHGLDQVDMLIQLIGKGTTLNVNPELFVTGVEKRFLARLSAVNAEEFKKEFYNAIHKTAERKQLEIPPFVGGKSK